MAQPTAKPKYQHVFEELRREITSGKYKAGAKFPSEADLVARFGISRITISRAVRELSELGLVERRAGSGTYVRSGRATDESSGLAFGLLIPDLGHTEIFESICQGMADAPQAGSHALLWSKAISSDSPLSRQEQASLICKQYIDRNVSGVFFAPFESLDAGDRTDERIVAALDQARIPVVLLDRDYLPYPRRSGHDLVGIDNRRAGFMATQHLLDLGARRIMFFSYPRGPSTLDERIAGYHEALRMHGIPADDAFVQRVASEDPESIRFLIDTLKPDAFVCGNDRTAGRLMHQLLAAGIRIPDDVRIVGIDDIAYASLLPVPLTTIHQPCHEIGIAAMSTMMERINRPKMCARDVLLDCRLVVRKSCGAA